MNIDMYCYLKKYTKDYQKEDCYQKSNGDQLEYNKVEVGFIMKFISQNLLYYYFEDHLELMELQEIHLVIGFNQIIN